MQRDDALRAQLAERLASWPLHAPDASGLKQAAVVLVVADEGPGARLRGVRQARGWSTQAALILTRRAKSLRGHAGQWALPGGRIDAGETPEQTALRELQEEVGLQLQAADVLGRLDTFITRSGYAITPVVVWGGEAAPADTQPGRGGQHPPHPGDANSCAPTRPSSSRWRAASTRC